MLATNKKVWEEHARRLLKWIYLLTRRALMGPVLQGISLGTKRGV
jgi:hypothetical protein